LRDEFKLAIDRKADAIIKDLDEYEKECKNDLDSRKKVEELGKIINGIMQDELAAWQETLRRFDAKEDALKLIKENGEQYKINELQTKLSEYEEDFLLRILDDYRQKVLSFCEIKLQSENK
jgi:hypothetical protein